MARDAVEAVLLAVVLFFVLQFFIQNTVVEGNSMKPNFVDREHLLVSKLSYRLGDPKRGDVVVFHAPGHQDKDFIKRVIGIAGDTVELRSGVVYINERPVEEPWSPIPDSSSFPPYTVPPEHLFVLGDNRSDSNDSRVFGRLGDSGLAQPAVPMALVVGRAWITVWPIERVGMVHEYAADAQGS